MSQNPVENGASSSDPSRNDGLNSQSNQLHLYPQLQPQPKQIKQPYTYNHPQTPQHPQCNNNEEKQIEGEGDNDNDSDEMIELEPEGMVIQKPTSSYSPPLRHENIDSICKSLHDSIGLFKSKTKRNNIFQKMVLYSTKSERIAIRNHYYKKYKVSLERVIQRNFNGTFRQILLYSIMSNEQLIVNDIEYALKNKNINKLSTILCTLDNNILKSVENSFNTSIYHKTKSLKQWTHNITSNIFYKRNINKFLLNILNGKRQNDGFVDMKKIEMDVKTLYNQLKHANKDNLNKEYLINMFTTRSFEHLYYISLKYEQKYNKSLVSTLKPLFKKSSETGYAIILILNYSVKKYRVYSTFLARAIHEHSNDGYGFFLRFIMLHYDYDLKNIIEDYGYSALNSWIKLELKDRDRNDETACIVLKLCGFS